MRTLFEKEKKKIDVEAGCIEDASNIVWPLSESLCIDRIQSFYNKKIFDILLCHHLESKRNEADLAVTSIFRSVKNLTRPL